MKIHPGDFVEAVKADGKTKCYGFVERIITQPPQQQNDSSSSSSAISVLSRAPRRPTDRFIIRSLLGTTMTPFTDETGTVTSDIDSRSEKAVIELPRQTELFKKEQVKLLSHLPPNANGEENNNNNTNFEFPGTDVEKQGLISLHKRLHQDKHFDSCLVCGGTGLLLMCETCVASGHLHCCSPPLAQVPQEYEWRCYRCLGKPSPIWSAVRFKRSIKRLLLELCELDIEGHFAHPVSIWFVVPSYGTLVPYPVDLSMMIQKAEKACYKSILEVVADLDTMVENCKRFNEGTLLAEYAVEFHRSASGMIQKLRSELREDDVAETYSNELMGLAAGFSSEYQAQRVDPISISVFGARALPLSARGSAVVVKRAGNNNAPVANNNAATTVHQQQQRPPEPLIFPVIKPASLATNLNAVVENPNHHHHQMNRRRFLQQNQNNNNNNNNNLTTANQVQQEKNLQLRALQLPDHVAKDPNFSFPHPVRVTLSNPCCHKGELRILYTTDGSHPAKSASSRLYDGKPILLSPRCVIASAEEIEKLLNTPQPQQQDTASSSSDEQQQLLLGEKITIKAICSLPHEMIDADKEDDRTRSQVATVTYKFASPHINYQTVMQLQQQQQQQQQQQDQNNALFSNKRDSQLRSSNHQRRSATNTTPSNLVELTTTKTNEKQELISLSSQRRRQRTVTFSEQHQNESKTENATNQNSNNEELLELSSSSSTTSLPVPVEWIVQPKWIQVFLGKIETRSDISNEEKEMYRKVTDCFVMNNNNRNYGQQETLNKERIHPEDWKRVLRDYTLFITMNSDLL